MPADACHICGCSDLNLVDGFYYCVECGTQDVNVKETVVENTIYSQFGDFTISDVKKYKTRAKEGVKMSTEWYKWHTYNFILVSLVDELITLGAKPTFKIKVLWIWLRYIKEFQNKDEPEATIFEDISMNETEDVLIEGDKNKNCDRALGNKVFKQKKKRRLYDTSNKHWEEIGTVTAYILLSILYMALNLDKSEIQLGHLFRFIKEGQLSVYDCFKFIPKELLSSTKLIPNFSQFDVSVNRGSKGNGGKCFIRRVSMALFQRLNLGVPLLPDMNIITDNYITELCLPKDFKDLVLSLTCLLPYSFITVRSVPDYEAISMSYILFALKMCFGLDDDYEIKLSDAVDKLNSEQNHLKCYTFGSHNESTDRLWSFREWYKFIQFRKMILCRYYLPMAQIYHLPVDDSVALEHTTQRKTHSIKLSYDVTMDILNKIPTDKKHVIPKKEFQTTFIPLTSHSDVIKDYINDPELKLRLCEDFKQYSLKYATRNLNLLGSTMKCEGIDRSNKIINSRIACGNIATTNVATNIVIVRNCDNKNWLQTKPPKPKHVTKVIKTNDGYDSSSGENFETAMDESDLADDLRLDSGKETCDVIEEEDEELSIFDDDFKYMLLGRGTTCQLPGNFKIDVHDNNADIHDSRIDLHDSIGDFNETLSGLSEPEIVFDPETFDRKKVIQELVDIVCKKYKIHQSSEEKKGREPKKRKNPMEDGVSKPKKKRPSVKIKPGESANLAQGLLSAYYENINNDLLLQISEHVRSIVAPVEFQDENIMDDAQNNLAEEIDAGDHATVNEDVRDCIDVLDGEQNVSFHDNERNEANSESDNDDEGFYIEDLLPKMDPNFDPRTHDIKQLYVKLNTEFDDFDFDEIENDPSMKNIIDKKISELQDIDDDENLKALHESNNGGSSSIEQNESDNNTQKNKPKVTLSHLKKENKSCSKYLLQNRKLRMFRYWTKWYTSENYIHRYAIHNTFDAEIAENCSKSFYFILSEGATIANCKPFHLYKALRHLEFKICRKSEIKIQHAERYTLTGDKTRQASNSRRAKRRQAKQRRATSRRAPSLQLTAKVQLATNQPVTKSTTSKR